MTIYLDLFIFENFIFTFFLLYITLRMLNFSLSIGRIFLSSTLSSLLGSTVFLFSKSFVFFLFITIVCIFITIYISISKITLNMFFQIFITITLISFLLFGFITFIKLNIENINYLHILIIFIFVFVISDLVKKYIKKNTFFNNYIFQVSFKYRNKVYKFKGFLDTGNELKEAITGLPVIIVETRCMPGIFYNEKYFYKIPYKVITGDVSYFEGVKVRNVCIKNNIKEFYTDVILCTTETSLDSERKFEAILSRCII